MSLPLVMPRRSLRRCGLLLTLSGAVACTDGSPSGPVDEPFATLTVDAAADWTYVDLDVLAREVQVADPATSGAWDIAFFASSVMLNGGAAGPGEVRAYCLCQNEGATNAQILAMNAESERAAFEATSPADIPSDPDAWLSEELTPAIDGWWSYDMTTHTVTAAADRAWIVRTAEGDTRAKLRVSGLAGGSQQNAGEVTLEFAIQPAAGEPFGPTTTLVADVSAGPVYVDLLEAAVSDESNWDLRLEGYTIRLNGGVSGSGQAGAVDAGTPYDAVPDAGAVPASVFKTDLYGGLFKAKPWYRYNLEGNHQIWPTYNIYLIHTGDEVYKLQLTSYYDPSDGEERHVSFRYALLQPLVD